MYHTIKKVLSGLLGSGLLVKYEIYIRNIYSIVYTGKKHQCNICNKNLSRFITMPNNDKKCPKCGSLARDRRLWELLTSGYLKGNIKVLDFSPSRPLARKMKEIKNIEYLNTDLSGNFIARYRFDITNIELPAESVDLIICYHVLEHIDNDSKAIRELYRILKRDGNAIIQTPFKDGEIYEDFNITSPIEREIHFGQDDHVRIYSVNGLRQRLQNTGFNANVRTFDEDIFYGLKTAETILTLTKQ